MQPGEFALAGAVVAVLRPFMKGLLARAEEIGEQAGREAGQKVLALARAIWSRLSPRVESTPSARAAADRVASAPTDQSAANDFGDELAKLLNADPALAVEIAGLIDQGRREGVVVGNVVSGIQYAETGGVNVAGDAANITTSYRSPEK